MTGIDTQPEGIHLVQLSHSRQAYALQKIGFFPFEAGVFANGRVVDWEGLSSHLFSCAREFDLVGSAVAAALPAPMVRLFRADMAGSASESQIYAQLEDELPGLGNAVVIDYCEMTAEPRAVVVAAAKRDYLERYSGCLAEAGFDLKIIDVDSYALHRAMRGDDEALLWQRRNTFTLIWRDEKDLLQQAQWQASHGEQNVAELCRHLEGHGIAQLQFCGSVYFAEFFNKTQSLPCVVRSFVPDFIKQNSKVLTSSVNLPDYLLAIGLAMREVPAW